MVRKLQMQGKTKVSGVLFYRLDNYSQFVYDKHINDSGFQNGKGNGYEQRGDSRRERMHGVPLSGGVQELRVQGESVPEDVPRSQAEDRLARSHHPLYEHGVTPACHARTGRSEKVQREDRLLSLGQHGGSAERTRRTFSVMGNLPGRLGKFRSRNFREKTGEDGGAPLLQKPGQVVDALRT